MKKNMTVTITLIVLLCLLSFLGLSGCADTRGQSPEPAGESPSSTDGSISGDPAEIRFAGFSAGEGNEQTLEDMLALFSDAYPHITVIDASAGYDDYFTELAARIGSGDAPDVFELDAAHTVAFSARGAVQPLDEMASVHGGDLGAYPEGLVRLCTIDKQLMALPFSYSAVMLLYNMDLFDAAGAAYPADNWVWEDVLMAAQKIAKPEEDIWGCYYRMDDFQEFRRRAVQNGGRLLNRDGTGFTLDAQQNVAALQWMQDLVWVYHVMPTVAEQAGRSEYDLFAAGKLGMFLSDTGTFADLGAQCGDIRWGVALEPGNSRKAAQVSCNALCVSSTAEAADAAYALIRFLTSDPGVQRLRLDAGWDLPPVSDPAVMDAYIQDTPPVNKASVLESTAYVIGSVVTQDIDILIDEILLPRLEAVRDNEEIPMQALKAAQAEAERRIALPQQ